MKVPLLPYWFLSQQWNTSPAKNHATLKTSFPEDRNKISPRNIIKSRDINYLALLSQVTASGFKFCMQEVKSHHFHRDRLTKSARIVNIHLSTHLFFKLLAFLRCKCVCFGNEWNYVHFFMQALHKLYIQRLKSERQH